MERKLAPFPASMSLLPISNVTLALPVSTMSTIVRKALAESLSEGAMKLPAALLITTSGRPMSLCILSITLLIASPSRTSADMACTLLPVTAVISAAVFSSTSSFLLVMIHSAPNLDSMVVMPLPRPVPPPVTSATFPLKQPSGSIGVFTAAKLGYTFFSLSAPTSASRSSMYFCMASSWLMPFKLFQASHLYLPFKSNMPGRDPSTSPTVACLKRA
mmetsp:Transcript_48036/g.124778  ORF Transcript_48036/g.124778 Transcript_48036/m.124778 type:complete len:217 (+) Transcript_48036:389-1039(+)